MRRFLASRLFAAALLLPGMAATMLLAPQPALAQWDDDQPDSGVGFDAFHDRLAPYGNWFETERWGTVWQPRDVGPDFRPYYDGHWVYTDDYGWYWDSDEDGGWGDIVYHYGRWVYDPNDGWLWVPGYVWGPAWVIWREGDDMTGWFPMPPDDAFYNGDDLSDDWGGYAGDDYYGYRGWYGQDFAPTFFSLWIFVPYDHFTDRHFHRYARRDRDRDDVFFRRTRDATRYGRADGYVVNRGVDPDRFYRHTGRRITPVPLRELRRPNAPPPARIDRGLRIRQRQLQERPNLMPRVLRTDRPFRQPGAMPQDRTRFQDRRVPENIQAPRAPVPPAMERPREQRREFRREQRLPRVLSPQAPQSPPVQPQRRQEFLQQQRQQRVPNSAPQMRPPPVQREQRQEFRQQMREQRQEQRPQTPPPPRAEQPRPRAQQPQREAPPRDRDHRRQPE